MRFHKPPPSSWLTTILLPEESILAVVLIKSQEFSTIISSEIETASASEITEDISNNALENPSSPIDGFTELVSGIFENASKIEQRYKNS